MKRVLSQFASFAVMIHMTFGCAWHHGFAAEHVCHTHDADSQIQVVEESDHDHECCCDHNAGMVVHEQPVSLGITAVCNAGCSEDHSHNHSGCQDDRCVFKQTSANELNLELELNRVAYTYSSAVISVNPLARCELLSLGRNSCVSAPGVRAHLLLGVLVL